MTNFVEITYSEWEEKFKPTTNHLAKYPDGINFETYGAEVEFVQSKIDERMVWTWLDADMCSVIANGYHYVNRLNYFVCEVPYEEDTDYQIITSTETECVCYDEETGDGKEDCDSCEGYGLVTVYND
jgi:hypothetical protein